MKKLAYCSVVIMVLMLNSCEKGKVEKESELELFFEKEVITLNSGTTEVYTGSIVKDEGDMQKIVVIKMQDGKIRNLIISNPHNENSGIFEYGPRFAMGKTVLWARNAKDTVKNIIFYPNGIQFNEINYVNGKINSISTEYDSTGKRVNWSKLVNGNGFFLSWIYTLQRYDTTFVLNGQVVREKK